MVSVLINRSLKTVLKIVIFCDYYILDISKKDTLTKLRLKSDRMSSEIQKQIATMQNISRNMFYNLDNLEYSMDDQEELFNLGNKLSRLFEKKHLLRLI